MGESSSINVAIDQRIEMSLYLIGVVLAVAAAYHTGQTGNWEPLMAVSVILTLLVLFVTSK